MSIKKIIRNIYIFIGVKLNLIPKHKGCVVLFTGLPCSGKTTIARGVLNNLKSKGKRAEMLDGDKFRKEFNNDLSFTPEDIHINMNRLSFVSKKLAKNNIIVLASFVSPFKIDREKIKSETVNFIEIHVACSQEKCEDRDTKGMWKKARAGEIKNFIGIDIDYENPEHPDEILFTEIDSVVYNTKKVIDTLKEKKII